MPAHKWQPIEGLNSQSCSVDFQEIDSLHRQWLAFRDERERSDPDAYKAFRERLDRLWSIETGIIEGIYDIDAGMTQTLVEHGLRPDLIDRTSTDRDPYDLVRILSDHQASAQFVTESIRQRKPLSTHYIRELHQLLTRNQPTYTAHDQFGRSFEAELDRGGFKKQPNNPTRPDGGIHEYCPPEQVDSEVDSLVALYREIERSSDSFHRLLVAAWLHHRFTQIHPFQDGNGRVARALLTWQLAKDGYLPIVVSRDDRRQYIEALESADSGALDPFVEFIVRLEGRTILQALAEPAPASDSGVVSQVLDHITERVKQQHGERLDRMRSVSSVAIHLQRAAFAYLESRAGSIDQRLPEAGLAVKCLVDSGSPGSRGYWYRAQVVQTAKDSGHWANVNEDRFFIRLSVSPVEPSGAPRLTFVISLHHVGRQLTGIMAATAFAQIVGCKDHAAMDADEPSGPDFRNCTINSFTFTSDDSAETVEPRFLSWIEAPLAIALRHWSEFIS